MTAQISGGVVTNVIVNNAGNGYTSSPVISFSAPASNVVVQTFWSNDGTSSNGSQPVTSVPLPVNAGLFSTLLGDTTLSNMTAVPATVFTNSDVRLRIWFNDGTNGFQQLTPDQRIAAVGYAMMADTAMNVPDGSITSAKLAQGSVGSSQLASNLTIPGTLSVSNLVVTGAASGFSNVQIPIGTNIQTYAGGSYLITNTSVNVILPLTANVGDSVHLIIPNPSSTINILQNPGQQIVKWNTLIPSYPVVSSSDGSRLLVNVGGNVGGGFFISTNFAASWTLQPPLEPWPTPNGYSGVQMSGDGSHIFGGVVIGGSPIYAVVASSDYGSRRGVRIRTSL